MAKIKSKDGQPGHYNASAPTLTDGDEAGFQFDINGKLLTSGGSVVYSATPPTLADGGSTSTQADINGNTKVTLATKFSYSNDSIYSYPKGTTPVNVTASTSALASGAGILVGMYVNSTSSGTIKIYDSATQAGPVINNTITPAVGWHNLGNANFGTGISVTIGSTLDVTLYYIPTP